MKKTLAVILCVVMMLTSFSFNMISFAEESGSTLYVSPVGDDKNIGSISSPLRTLSGAKEKAKTIKGAVTVCFREGSYTINQTINFSADDKANVVYKAYKGEKVVFTSGIPYTGFERCTVNGVSAFKKNVGKDADFNVLFNDKTTLNRTRYPESGYLYVKSVNADDTDGVDEVHSHCTGLNTDGKSLMNFKNYKDVVVRILHYWKDEMSTIVDINVGEGHIKLSRPTSMRIENDNRFFLENVFETLNEPGEWYLDKSEGVLYYIPFENENENDITLWASTTETMISINGVDGISFSNIIFRGNGFNIPHNNSRADDSSQAGFDATPCISYSYANNFTVKNCDFRDIAACAVFMGRAVKNATVDSCVFDNIGAQAVYIKGENVQLDSPLITRDITIKNCLVSKYGRVFFNAVGILIIHANSVNVLNNEIHDGYYSAISVGWVWGYAYSVTNNCKICDNLIYNIGQGWLSDMGGIYTLGIQEGTVLSGNVIHNVAADPGEGGYGGWGIYPDEGSSKMLIEKNLVYACGSDAYHLHYGSYNTVRNNIFALSGESQVRVVSAYKRVETVFGGKKSADFMNNILLSDGGVCTFSHLAEKDACTTDNNILWDLDKGDKVYASKDVGYEKSMSVYKAEKKGYLNNSVIADPMFKDARNFDFELDENSPAIKAGFEAWDYSNAGTLKGTTIGVDTQGGTTAYNSNSNTVEYSRARNHFEPFTAMARFFVKIFNKIFNR